MREDFRALHDQMNRREKDYMSKIGDLEDLIENLKEKIEKGQTVFQQAQSKLK